MKGKKLLQYFIKNMCTIIGIILIWRGIWYILDGLDKIFFNGGHIWTAFLGVVIGLALLYLPDKDLKELERL